MVLNDFLDLETARNPQKSRKSERVDVDALAHSVVRMFTGTARNKVSLALYQHHLSMPARVC